MSTEAMTTEQFKRALGIPAKHKPVKKAKPKKEHKLSSLEKQFLMTITGLPQPEREHRFHPIRRWRFDFAYVAQKLAIEVQGGSFVKGGHNRAGHQASDCEKFNEAQLLGWRVLQFNTVQMKEPQSVRETVERALASA
jgi:very-short-patch-repair endonuclease